MSVQEAEELNPSDLGTIEFWEKVYSEELANFKDHGDVGEIWFGRKNALKILRWIMEMNLNKEIDKIIDIGCGNGMMLMELSKRGFSKLIGVDYSQKAVDLASEILTENNISNVELAVCDILDEGSWILPTDFKIVHDKGTYDAISLSPENSAEKRRTYTKKINKILSPSGYLIMTSCNWTKEELKTQFEEHFVIVNELPADQFQFGGQTGNTVTQLILKKK